jgi:hypothetical protein
MRSIGVDCRTDWQVQRRESKMDDKALFVGVENSSRKAGHRRAKPVR